MAPPPAAPPALRRVRAVVLVRPALAADAAVLCERAADGPADDAVLCERAADGWALSIGGAAFAFPAVYGGGAEPIDEFCAREVEPLLAGAINGEAAAVLAYGQTGSGKSYACGTEARPEPPWPGSIAAYVARRLWARGAPADLSVDVSFREIYKEGTGGEAAYDLLGGLTRARLTREEPPYKTAASPAELIDLLADGARLRSTDRTIGNARSSRSHALVVLRLRHTARGAGVGGRRQLVTGTFTLADLAGSENAALAGENRTQAAQGSGINVGLSVLQSVIDDVARSGRSVRYRDSKLTFSLRGALGGAGDGARALFMACISPAAAHAERSRRTLATATRAACIENSVARHVSAVAAAGAAGAAELDALRAQVAQLALELAEARAELAVCPPSAAAAAAAAPPPTAPASRPSAAAPMLVLPEAEVEALRRAAEEQRDRADALSVVLREADRRHAALAAQLAAAGGARASPGPALAALAAAPILAAARAGGADSNSDGEGYIDDDDYGGDAPEDAAAAAAVPMLSLDEVCLAADESSLALLQRGVLRELAGRRLAEGAAAAAAAPDAAAATAAARRAEVAALRLAVRAYNACAGEAEAGRAAAAELLHQAAEEKVRYVRLSASYQVSCSAASLVGQSKQKPSWKPTNQPTNQPTTNYRPLPTIKLPTTAHNSIRRALRWSRSRSSTRTGSSRARRAAAAAAARPRRARRRPRASLPSSCACAARRPRRARRRLRRRRWRRWRRWS
jgi:hypothetical protein